MATRSIPILASIAEHASDTSFVLMMEHKVKGHHGDSESGYKDYSYHPRFSQPCQGGETRKYASHNRKCTQPHNKKPTDLFHPFPEGKPSAIAFPLMGKNMGDPNNIEFFNAVFSNASPWFKGFGGRHNVQFLNNSLGQPYGVIIGVKNLDVDPTIMISAIQLIRNSSAGAFHKLKANGFTDNEALAVLMLNNGDSGQYLYKTGEYYTSPYFSARRFFEQAPNDLSGGYYSDGADYNRTYCMDVFKADKEDGPLIWFDAMTKELGITGAWGATPVDQEKFFVAAKKVLKEAWDKEGPLTNKPYQYRNASGRVIDLTEKKVPKVKEAKAA